jgi:hypothetical protein
LLPFQRRTDVRVGALQGADELLGMSVNGHRQQPGIITQRHRDRTPRDENDEREERDKQQRLSASCPQPASESACSR